MTTMPAAPRSASVAPLRIAFVLGTLQGGGAERVACILAGEWRRRGHAVTLLTLEGDAAPAYPLDPGVEVRRLDLLRPVRTRAGALGRVLRGVRTLRRAIRELGPDVAVSFLDEVNVRTLLACRGLDLPVVVSERIHPGAYRISWFWRLLRRRTYGRAAALVVQTRSVAAWCRARYGVGVRVIPNPVPAAPPLLAADEPRDDRRRLVAVGRLAPQKGFDLLLEAFARLAPDFPEWDLVIHGEGPERAALEAQILRLGLEGRAGLPGWTDELPEVLARADAFCLPSRFEGFPNALCEAMRAGLAVVAADCPGGPADIVTPDTDGLLVPAGDVAALTEGLRRLLDDAALRARLGANAASIAERYEPARIADLWLACFEQCRRARRGDGTGEKK